MKITFCSKDNWPKSLRTAAELISVNKTNYDACLRIFDNIPNEPGFYYSLSWAGTPDPYDDYYYLAVFEEIHK
jgi:hypothetical protein